MNPRRGTTIDNQRVYTVTTADGIPVSYDTWGPPAPFAALIVPGFWRTRQFPSMVGLARSLGERGLSSAILDCRGHGGSGGTYEFNTREHLDVAAVAKHISGSGFASRLLLIGFSAGGAIAISAAARDQLPLAGLLLVSAVSDFKRVIPRPNPFTIHRHLSFAAAIRPPRFRWNEREHLDPLQDVTAVRAPLLLVHGRNDWLVHHAHSERLFAAANDPRELRILDLPGRLHADHILTAAGAEFWPIADEFFGRVL